MTPFWELGLEGRGLGMMMNFEHFDSWKLKPQSFEKFFTYP